LITGSISESFNDGEKILLIKIDQTGKVTWIRTYYDPTNASFLSNENGVQAEFLPNGNIAMIANQRDLFVNSGAFLMEIKPNGDFIRAIRIRINAGALFTLSLNKMIPEGNDTFVIAAGVTQDSTPSVSIEQNILFKIKYDGSIIWQHNYRDEILGGFGTALSDVTRLASGGFAHLINDALGFDEFNPILIVTDAKGETGCELPIQLGVQSNINLVQEAITVTELPGNSSSAFPLVQKVFPFQIDLPKATFPADTAICQSDTIVLAVIGQNIQSYKWSTGENTPQISANMSGNYIVTVTNDDFCYESIDTIKLQVIKDCNGPDTFNVEVPTAFSPNRDMNNETFEPIGKGFVIKKMQIFNRWGKLVYTSGLSTASWDGKVGGEDAPIDTYFYVLLLQANGVMEQRSGEVTLLR
jgi:gliding motility-associated-like protein